MSEPGIVRVNRAPSSFFTAHKGPFEDDRLSWEAKGMMAYLLTKPEGWQISIVDLIKASPAKVGLWIKRISPVNAERENAT